MINRLYSILTSDIEDNQQDWYRKERVFLPETEKMRNIKKGLQANVSDETLIFYSCVVCALSLRTQYGAEIRARDQNNTYFLPEKDPGKRFVNCPSLSDISSEDVYNKIKIYLDSDILESLVTPLWHEVVAAGCLQLLREADKA